MKITEYLNSYKKIFYNIQNIENEIAELEAMATSITTPTDKEAIKSSKEDKTSKLVAEIIDRKNDRKEMLSELLRQKTDIINLIESVSNPTYYQILYKRHIEFKHLTEISEELNYSYAHLCVLYREAIAAVETKKIELDKKLNI